MSPIGRHLKERERDDEPYGHILVTVLEPQNVSTVMNLFDFSLLSVEFVDDGVTVIALVSATTRLGM